MPKRLKGGSRSAETTLMRPNRVSSFASTFILVAVMAIQVPSLAQSGFIDVPEDAYYSAAVAWMVDEGLATGGSDGRFRPDDAVTRGETAVFLWRLAGEPPARVHNFSDVTVGWQDAAVAWMAETGISNGASPTQFDPDGMVTRANLSVFLHRLAGEPSAPSHGFFDVPDQSADAAVSWVAEEQISSGVAPGEFAPDRNVIRGELAVFLARFSAVWSTPTDAPVVEVDPETVESTFAPVLAASPSSPRVGEHVVVTGTGFAPGSVLLTLGNAVAGVVEANASGAFRLEVDVPELDAGGQSMVAVADGQIVASTDLDVRPAAPEPVSPLPVILLVATLAFTGYWVWKRKTSSEIDSEPETAGPGDVETNADPSPPTGVEPRIADLVSISPLDIGAIEHIEVLQGALWGTGNMEFEGVDHAVVMIYHSSQSRWEMAADLGPGRIDAIAVSGADAVAVGSRLVGDDDGMVRRSTMWHSTDLKSWVAIGLTGESFSESSFDQVVAVGEALVVHGRSASGPSIWTGTKLGWRCRSMPGPVDVVAATAHGVVAFGRDSEQRSAVVLSSSDGINWDTNDGLSAALFDSATVLAAVDFDGGLVAAGYDNLRGTAAIWVSDDGSAWHRAPCEFPEGTGIEHLVVVEDTLVAIGAVRATASGKRTTEFGIWTSRDSVEWQIADLDGLSVNGRISGVAVDRSAVVIVGSHGLDGESASTPVVWRYFGADLQTTVS